MNNLQSVGPSSDHQLHDVTKSRHSAYTLYLYNHEQKKIIHGAPLTAPKPPNLSKKQPVSQQLQI